ncbi:MAG: succinate dehydrogenase [Clostridia bacterium]|nr:succinate dehydrogenase [Clostridia bacterium]
MLKFIVMLPFRILFLPVLLFFKLTFWICTGLLCMTEWVFGLASVIMLVLSILGMIWVSVPQGIVMIGIAFLISPYGIPMLALKLVMFTEVMAEFLWEKVY